MRNLKIKTGKSRICLLDGRPMSRVAEILHAFERLIAIIYVDGMHPYRLHALDEEYGGEAAPTNLV